MIDVRPLPEFDPAVFKSVVTGYTSDETYLVAWVESDGLASFTLTLTSLPEPAVYRFPSSATDLERYAALVPNAYCLGAYDGEQCVGVALGEVEEWNATVQIWEFHVTETHRGLGIGRRLMDSLAAQAQADGLRALVAETQNTNVPAIRFYRSAGFRLEGVDISYYTNEDMAPGGTVAIFMKRRLE